MRKARVWLCFDEWGVSLCCDGSLVKGLHPDERSIAAAMRRTLIAHCTAANSDTNADVAKVEERIGWSVRQGGFASLLEELDADGAALLCLDEFGDPLPQALGELSPETRTATVVGDQLGFSRDEQEQLRRLGARRVSVGPLPLLASHCIVLAHSALDARWFTEREQR